MPAALHPLPENPDELRAFAQALQARTQVLEDELYAKTLHIEKLKMQLAALRRMQFGRSSERLNREIEQLELAIGDLEESHARHQAQHAPAAPSQNNTASTAPASSAAKGVPTRKALPADLPRERIEHPAACACPACGSTKLTCIGTDEREVLEYVRGGVTAHPRTAGTYRRAVRDRGGDQGPRRRGTPCDPAATRCAAAGHPQSPL